MTLNRWDPLRDLLNFQERMNRAMDSAFFEAISRPTPAWTPVVDVLETPEAYIFRADLPGVGKDRISIEVIGNRLIIRGERTPKAESGLTSYHRLERESGYFERSFGLPGDVDVERAEATYEDGVLQLVLPKSESELRPRSMTIVCLG